MNATKEIRSDSSQVSFEERTGHEDERLPIPVDYEVPEETPIEDSKDAIEKIDALVEDLKAHPAPHREGMVQDLEGMKTAHENALGVSTKMDSHR